MKNLIHILAKSKRLFLAITFTTACVGFVTFSLTSDAAPDRAKDKQAAKDQSEDKNTENKTEESEDVASPSLDTSTLQSKAYKENIKSQETSTDPKSESPTQQKSPKKQKDNSPTKPSDRPYVPGEVVIKLDNKYTKKEAEAIARNEIIDDFKLKKVIDQENNLYLFKSNTLKKESKRSLAEGNIDKTGEGFEMEEVDPLFSFALHELNNHPQIEYAEPDYTVTAGFIPNDPHFLEQWALNNIGQTGGTPDADIDAPEAWNIEQGSEEVIIAIIDTGVDYNHEDLADKMWINPGEIAGNGVDDDGNGYIDDVRGWDFLNNDNDPMDDHNHGTHCAGIAAGSTDNVIGIAGACPNCKIMPLKFLDETAHGSSSDAVEAIHYAIDNGAKVLSNSWGSSFYSTSLRDAVDRAVENSIVVVACAMNWDSPDKYYPAAYDNVLAIAATDHNDVRSSFSNYGDWIDLSAPGSSILSTLRNNGYGLMWGTSMSTPQVAGTAGLIFSQHPDWSAGMVFGQVKYSTDNIDALNPDYEGKLGTGRLNAYNALLATGEPKIYFYRNSATPVNEIWPNEILEPGEDADMYVSLRNEWATATNVYGELTTTDSYITINNTHSDYPDIAGLEIGENLTPFNITLSPDTPPGHTINFELLVTYQYNSTAHNEIFPFSYTITSDIGWPKLGSGYKDIVFEDLDLDGEKEVIIARKESVNAYTPDGHVIWTYSQLYNQTIEVLLIGNVDAADENPEIVFTAISDYPGFFPPFVYILGSDGEQKTTLYDRDRTMIFSNPTLEDTDGDEINEIIIGGYNSTTGASEIRAYKIDRTILWTRQGLPTGTDSVTSSAVGDIDGDGSNEFATIFVQSGDPLQSKILLTNTDGSDNGTEIAFVDESTSKPPTLGDMDSDGDLEIVVTTRVYDPLGENVHIYHHDGSQMAGWPKYLNQCDASMPALADTNTDGNLEIFIKCMSGDLYGWHHDGTEIAGWPVFDEIAHHSWNIQPAIAGIDSDNEVEILFNGSDDDMVGSGNSQLLAYNSDGTTVTGYPLVVTDLTSEINKTTLGNLSTSNTIHIGVATTQGIFLINTENSYNEQTMEWPMYMHDLRRTGCYESLYEPPTEPVFKINKEPQNTSLTYTTYLDYSGQERTYSDPQSQLIFNIRIENTTQIPLSSGGVEIVDTLEGDFSFLGVGIGEDHNWGEGVTAMVGDLHKGAPGEPVSFRVGEWLTGAGVFPGKCTDENGQPENCYLNLTVHYAVPDNPVPEGTYPNTARINNQLCLPGYCEDQVYVQVTHIDETE